MIAQPQTQTHTHAATQCRDGGGEGRGDGGCCHHRFHLATGTVTNQREQPHVSAERSNQLRRQMHHATVSVSAGLREK